MPRSAAARPATAGDGLRAGGAPTGAPLVTGGGGFAGRHLVRLLSRDARTPAAPSRAELDVTDGAAVCDAMRELAPAEVFHLAAFSSARLSWRQPEDAVLGNLRMTLNVLRAVRDEAPAARLVLVGSGQVYGAPGELPLTEAAALSPSNPYATSKAAADMLGRQFAAEFGLRVVRVRPFNHAGPGQSDEYVLSTLARQVAEAERSGDPEVLLRTGDTSVARDFCDVRDVVRAYVLAAGAEPGAYNVCSGRATTITDLIELLDAESSVAIRHEIDPQRLRSADAPEIWGSHERLSAATAWRPEIPLATTVRDTLDWWRERLR